MGVPPASPKRERMMDKLMKSTEGPHQEKLHLAVGARSNPTRGVPQEKKMRPLLAPQAPPPPQTIRSAQYGLKASSS